LLPSIDGNWVDIGTVLSGFVALALGAMVRGFRGRIGGYKAVEVFLAGATMFPFLLLCLPVFSNQLLAELLSASKVTLALAGVVATIHSGRSLLDQFR
jgi:hypothetical protein